MSPLAHARRDQVLHRSPRRGLVPGARRRVHAVRVSQARRPRGLVPGGRAHSSPRARGSAYEPVGQSQALPGIDLVQLAGFLDRPTATRAILDYRAALRGESVA
jgi:hypothetical protein